MHRDGKNIKIMAFWELRLTVWYTPSHLNAHRSDNLKCHENHIVNQVIYVILFVQIYPLFSAVTTIQQMIHSKISKGYVYCVL
jgi:hypothetical protein